MGEERNWLENSEVLGEQPRRDAGSGMRFNQPEFSGNTSLETHL